MWSKRLRRVPNGRSFGHGLRWCVVDGTKRQDPARLSSTDKPLACPARPLIESLLGSRAAQNRAEIGRGKPDVVQTGHGPIESSPNLIVQLCRKTFGALLYQEAYPARCQPHMLNRHREHKLTAYAAWTAKLFGSSGCSVGFHPRGHM